MSDEETVEPIWKNPCLQYFAGFHEYSFRTPFDPSMMVHFRARFGGLVGEINEAIIAMARENGLGGGREEEGEDEKGGNGEDDGQTGGPRETDAGKNDAGEKKEHGETPNQGSLLIEATCTPADLTYPTDLKRLDEARRKTEQYLDILQAQGRRKFGRKPRTYRKKARKEYLVIAKTRKPGARKIRRAIGRQLSYVRRNREPLGRLVDAGAELKRLSRYPYQGLLVIGELHRQQLEMHRERKHRVEHRIA